MRDPWSPLQPPTDATGPPGAPAERVAAQGGQREAGTAAGAVAPPSVRTDNGRLVRDVPPDGGWTARARGNPPLDAPVPHTPWAPSSPSPADGAVPFAPGGPPASGRRTPYAPFPGTDGGHGFTGPSAATPPAGPGDPWSALPPADALCGLPPRSDPHPLPPGEPADRPVHGGAPHPTGPADPWSPTPPADALCGLPPAGAGARIEGPGTAHAASLAADPWAGVVTAGVRHEGHGGFGPADVPVDLLLADPWAGFLPTDTRCDGGGPGARRAARAPGRGGRPP
ncbi:hypothetical protein ACFVUM_31330, partial [Streptomyces sp. NPDC058084]